MCWNMCEDISFSISLFVSLSVSSLCLSPLSLTLFLLLPLCLHLFSLDRHVQSHHGHHKPFRCKLCPFKSAYLSRLKSHLHKAHAGRKQPQHTSLSSIRLPETDSVHGGVRNRTLFPTHPRKEILYYTMV